MSRATQIDALTVTMVTDGRGDPARLLRMVRAAAGAGVRGFWLREPQLDARRLVELCDALGPVVAAVAGALLVGDRCDVAVAADTAGVHLGERSLTPRSARTVVGDRLVGFSAHDPAQIGWAAAQGADYVTLSPVLATGCKPGVAPIGIERALEWTRAATLPVLWLGGIDADAIAKVARPNPVAGYAVRGALSDERTIAEQAARLVAEVGQVRAWQ